MLKVNDLEGTPRVKLFRDPSQLVEKWARSLTDLASSKYTYYAYVGGFSAINMSLSDIILYLKFGLHLLLCPAFTTAYWSCYNFMSYIVGCH